MEYPKIAFYAILMLLAIMLFGITQNYILALDMSGWTFLGHAEAANLILIIPYLFLISALLIPAIAIMESSRNG